MMWLHMAFWVVLPFAHTTSPPDAAKKDLVLVANAYATAAGLPALNLHADFELRVWIRAYISESVFGEIVTNGQLRILRTKAAYKGGQVVVRPAELGAPSPVADVHTLEKLVAQLKSRNGTAVACPVFDGSSVLVHAVLHGRVIAVQIDNPGFCTDAPSKALTRLLDALDHEIALHCNTGEPQTVGGPWVTGFWRIKGSGRNDSSGEILQFRPDGTVVFYDSAFQLDAEDSKKTYRIDDDVVSITVNIPDEAPVTLRLHVSKDRKTLTPMEALLSEDATLKRITDYNCTAERKQTR